jgi:hypothetical protein
MRFKLPQRRVWVIAASASALVTAVGVAYATIPDSNGVIHGCYAKNSGALRVIDTGQACTTKETGLNWDQTGPAGPQGSSGPAGPSGVTTAYFRESLTGRPLVGAQDVLTLEVSATRSMLFGTVQLINNASSSRPGICDVVAPDGAARRGFVDIEANSKAQLYLINVSTSPGTARITCYDPGDGSISIDVPTSLAALEVSTLNVQEP